MAPIKLNEPTGHHQYLSLFTVKEVLRCNQYMKHRLINCTSIIIIIDDDALSFVSKMSLLTRLLSLVGFVVAEQADPRVTVSSTCTAHELRNMIHCWPRCLVLFPTLSDHLAWIAYMQVCGYDCQHHCACHCANRPSLQDFLLPCSQNRRLI